MKIYKIAAIFVVILLAAVAIISIHPAGDRETLYQVSVLNGLLQGDYDGKLTLGEIRRHGDFGLGTFDRLDGEAIELDGIFYQVKADGTVVRMDGRVKSPFAMATFFDTDMEFILSRIPDYRSMKESIDNCLPSKNIPYAIKIYGKFDRIKVRSVPAQNKPYPVFSEVAKNQSVFEFRDMEGTLAGFKLPDYMDGVNVGGYHLHFLSRDRTRGGHLLECAVNEARVRIDDIKRFDMVLPPSSSFYGLDLASNGGEGVKGEKSK